MDTGVARDPVESVSKFTYTNFNNSKKLIGETKYKMEFPKQKLIMKRILGQNLIIMNTPIYKESNYWIYK